MGTVFLSLQRIEEEHTTNRTFCGRGRRIRMGSTFLPLGEGIRRSDGGRGEMKQHDTDRTDEQASESEYRLLVSRQDSGHY